MPWISEWFAKNCIITSFLVCSIFVAVLCLSQLTFAQPDFDRSDGSSVIAPVEGNILWDQSDNREFKHTTCYELCRPTCGLCLCLRLRHIYRSYFSPQG